MGKRLKTYHRGKSDLAHNFRNYWLFLSIKTPKLKINDASFDKIHK
jgi:hypothetical protein